MKSKYMYLMITCLAMGSGAFAQSSHLQGIEVENQKVSAKAGKLDVAMDILLDGVELKSNDKIILTPVLKSNTEETALELPVVIVAGKKRNKILKREQKLHNFNEPESGLQSIVRYNQDEAQQIAYSAEIPLAQWMRDASLSLKEERSGCADCNKDNNSLLLASHVLDPEAAPAYKLTYIMPKTEVKTLNDRHTATFNYVVDRYELVRNYKNNADKFEEVDKIINDIQNNPDFKITEFEIAGYASPEATVEHNRVLAENRANSFANYLVSRFGIERDKFKVQSFGEDWDGLRKAVVSSTLSDKEEVLKIIDNVSNPDARDAELKKLSGGETYRKLLQAYYPSLRRTEYVIAYNVRPFNVEEARQVIKTNPRLLSLNEMYLVAESYPKESKEFKEVFDIATRLYPDSDIAILNSAAADVENGNVEAAIERMLKISGNAKVWNNLGVGYARKGNLEKAKEYLEKALSEGSAEAKHNIEELAKTNRYQ